MRVLKLLWIFIDRVVCKCHSDNALFRFFIDRILFRVLSDRVLFEYSVIQSFSGFAVIIFFSWMHFFSHVAIFYQIVLPFFLSKADVLFYIHYIFTCLNNFNNTDHKKWMNRSSRPEMFCKKGIYGNFTKFSVKHHFQSLFFYKLAALRPATLLKKRVWHKRFPVNFAKFLRTSFLTEHFRWLLLNEERLTW